MKVIFMGTPDFSVPCLEMLIKEGYEVPLVVTQPDRQRGRGHKVSFSPVKELALSMNIPVFQPESLKNNELLSYLDEIKPDVYTKGADYTMETLPEADIMRKNNIKVEFITFVEGQSTTNIINKISDK